LAGHPLFVPYMKLKLFPVVIEIITTAAGLLKTIQFNGSMTELLSWSNQLALRSTDFPGDLVLTSINTESPLLVEAFLLSFFDAPSIVQPVLEATTSESNLALVRDKLVSNDEQDIREAILLLKTIAICDKPPLERILPPGDSRIVDVLGCLPSGWLIECDGPTSLDAYISDAMDRITVIGNWKGENEEIVPSIVRLLQKFDDLPLDLCLSFTQLIVIFAAASPNIINEELIENFKSAVEHYANVETFSLPDGTEGDSPEVRAAILAEFGKELHSTLKVPEIMRKIHVT